MRDTERAAVEFHLKGLIHPEDFESWWDLSIPALGGLSAREMVERGQVEQVLRHVNTYHDYSFS